jgi:hypothetical protein
MAWVTVSVDRLGQIMFIVQPAKAKDHPPAGVLPTPGIVAYEVELTEDQEQFTLLDLHVGHLLKVEDGRALLQAKRGVSRRPPEGR